MDYPDELNNYFCLKIGVVRSSNNSNLRSCFSSAITKAVIVISKILSQAIELQISNFHWLANGLPADLSGAGIAPELRQLHLHVNQVLI